METRDGLWNILIRGTSISQSSILVKRGQLVWVVWTIWQYHNIKTYFINDSYITQSKHMYTSKYRYISKWFEPNVITTFGLVHSIVCAYVLALQHISLVLQVVNKEEVNKDRRIVVRIHGNVAQLWITCVYVHSWLTRLCTWSLVSCRRTHRNAEIT